jgi:hypothetical protein
MRRGVARLGECGFGGVGVALGIGFLGQLAPVVGDASAEGTRAAALQRAAVSAAADQSRERS